MCCLFFSVCSISVLRMDPMTHPPTQLIYYRVSDARQCPLGHVLRTSSCVSFCVYCFLCYAVALLKHMYFGEPENSPEGELEFLRTTRKIHWKVS